MKKHDCYLVFSLSERDNHELFNTSVLIGPDGGIVGIYLVTSTYTNHKSNWMKTAIWDREGNRISEANERGTVVMAEVDLNLPTHWPFLGDFKSRINREGPIRKAE